MFKLTKLVKKPKRVGRGYGSGKGGHTSGRGQKGQRSRGKGKPGILQAGGQIPTYRKLPLRRGFGNNPVTRYTVITIDRLIERMERMKIRDKIVTPALLQKMGFKESKDGYKIIGRLEKKVGLSFKDIRLSKGVKESLSSNK